MVSIVVDDLDIIHIFLRLLLCITQDASEYSAILARLSFPGRLVDIYKIILPASSGWYIPFRALKLLGS